MGIETALLAMGASAGVASAVGTGATILGGLGALKGMRDLSKAAKTPAVKPLTAADRPPAAAKAPDRPAMARTNAAAAAGPGGGASGTFLTGPSGVDPSTLNLGRNTLLGQ